MTMKYVVMLDRSAGNEQVGESWTETKVFLETATLADVEAWVRERTNFYHKEPEVFTCNVRLAVAQ